MEFEPSTWLYNYVKETPGQGQRTNAVTEWAHCQRQVAFLYFPVILTCTLLNAIAQRFITHVQIVRTFLKNIRAVIIVFVAVNIPGCDKSHFFCNTYYIQLVCMNRSVHS